ncbi:helix-turn-helix domain-containing protein [Catenulispora acidiphila]|uniref:helix-turn-helix domain-containing protein n=1 Tax=Catenulispora acidiphila TaxID=304895 RepID=UPI00019DEEBF|nr:MerR family transcriptional regulator [Catenulispora acidiphila]
MNGDSAAWTIDRLARLAAAALAAGAPTQPNGRIREVPDVRTIRWYTSIGLLGRPAAMRGRTALYGRSHLAQLVAIKRLQADGLTVAAVQERLLGADESAIEEIALLPADLEELITRVEGTQDAGEPERKPEPKAQTRARFWVAPVASTPADEEPAASALADHDALARSAAPASPAEPITAAPITAAPITTDAVSDIAVPVHGIRLAPDVTLLLPPGRVPDAAARAAIAEASRPLLDLLERLGLSET